MKFINSKRVNSNTNIYTIDSINNVNEIISLFNKIKTSYGNITNIQMNTNNSNISLNSFDDLIKINIDLNNITSFVFESDNKFKFNLDIKNKTLSVENLKEDTNIIYYKFDNGLIVKYDRDKGALYYLDENKNWIYDNTLIEKIYEDNYEQIEYCPTKNK